MTATVTLADNPLLIGQGLPPFDAIEPQHVVPALTQLLTELEASLAALESSVDPTWSGLVEPLQRLGERLNWSWSIVGHLMGVKNSPELRSAHETVQPEVVKFWSKLSQSKPLYEAFKALRASENWDSLESAQQRIVEAALRDAQLSGVGLEGEQKERFNAIQLELAEITTQFSNHVLDATKAFSLTLTNKDEIDGLPPSLLSLAAQAARSAGEENAEAENGPWRITLDFPSYGPFMQHSTRRDLREKLYKAFIGRASSGELNNWPLTDRILALRQEKAALLGFSSYAELSLASKMAPDVAAVEALLEELRPYFALPQVLEGLFGLVKWLFGVTVTAADGQTPVWHKDVRYFQIDDEAGNAIANFYLDPYSRPEEKRGGAWMDECVVSAKFVEGSKTTTRLPVAYLVCNQSPPVDGKPSLMTFGEVETLFHEFGHGLQHMLTTVDYPGASGINNVEWDAVELPSQFMENWCYDRATLFGMAKHYETGETLPEHYYQKLLAARHYMSGTVMLRQVHFSSVDIELYHRYRSGGSETVADVRNRIAKTTTVLPPLEEDAFLCAFGHIFAGGYAAGYYSYKWAEVLSADAFAAFEEAGLEDESAIASTGKRFRDTVLGLGGSLHPMEVFKTFRGREPSTKALLRHSGLVAA